MWPLVVLGAAAWYLSRPQRNPDWITVEGKHIPLRHGDGRSNDPTPYDPARVGETGTARATRTAASPGFEAPESEAELRGEAKRLYARYKQVHAEFDKASREADEASQRAADHNNRSFDDEKTVAALTENAVAAQNKVAELVADAVGTIHPSLYKTLEISVRRDGQIATYPYVSGRDVMDANNAAQLVPDLQAWQKALTQAIGKSDAQLAVAMGLIPEATFRGAELRKDLERTRDKIPAIIKAARTAITAATKAREAKENQREWGKGEAVEASAAAWKRRDALSNEVRDAEIRLEELTGHRVYNGEIHFESRASRDYRVRAEAARQAEARARADEQIRLRQQAAAEKQRIDNATAQAAQAFQAELRREREKEDQKREAMAVAREARLARATAKDLERLVAQANDLASKYNAQVNVARQWTEYAERSGGGLTQRGNFEYTSAMKKANVAASKAREYETRYRELERAIAAIKRGGR